MNTTTKNVHKIFSAPLMDWFEQFGRHHLPWQNPRTAYRVWVSEVMLQQTQVTTVIPYFNRFMDRFPDVWHLAQASEDEVLAHWSGLGYYSRGRNLHCTAKMVHETYQGRFPDTLETLIQLPGIGPSTAAAIASLAFNQPTAILDGNVKRVLSRFFLVDGTPDTKAVKEALWQLAHACMPQENCASYTQAIMDLGATCCTPKNPNCANCPLRPNCLAFQKNLVLMYPFKKEKKTKPIVHEQFLLLHRGENHIYLEKNPPTGLWGSLWCLPRLETDQCPETFVREKYTAVVHDIRPILTMKHSFSHFHLHINALSLKIESQINDKCMESTGQWVACQDIRHFGIPKPVRVILETHLQRMV